MTDGAAGQGEMASREANVDPHLFSISLLQLWVVAANSIKTSVLSPSPLRLLTLKPEQIESLHCLGLQRQFSANKFIITIKRSLIYGKILKQIFMVEINTFCCDSLEGPHKQQRISGLGL